MGNWNSNRNNGHSAQYNKQGYNGVGFNSDFLAANNISGHTKKYYDQGYHGDGFNSSDRDFRHDRGGFFDNFFGGRRYGGPRIGLDFRFGGGESAVYQERVAYERRSYSQDLQHYAEKYANSDNLTDHKFGLLCHEALKLEDPGYSEAVKRIRDIADHKTGGFLGVGAHLDQGRVDGLLATRFDRHGMYEYDRAVRNGTLEDFTILKEESRLKAPGAAAINPAENRDVNGKLIGTSAGNIAATSQPDGGKLTGIDEALNNLLDGDRHGANDKDAMRGVAKYLNEQGIGSEQDRQGLATAIEKMDDKGFVKDAGAVVLINAFKKNPKDANLATLALNAAHNSANLGEKNEKAGAAQTQEAKTYLAGLGAKPAAAPVQANAALAAETNNWQLYEHKYENNDVGRVALRSQGSGLEISPNGNLNKTFSVQATEGNKDAIETIKGAVKKWAASDPNDYRNSYNEMLSTIVDSYNNKKLIISDADKAKLNATLGSCEMQPLTSNNTTQPGNQEPKAPLPQLTARKIAPQLGFVS